MLPELPFANASDRVGKHLHDPGAAWPVRLEVIGSSFSFKLAGQLTAQGALVVLDRQAHVGPLESRPNLLRRSSAIKNSGG